MVRNIIENKKDRLESCRQISRALRPLRKALVRFKKSVSKVDWDRLNKEIQKGGH